MNLDSKEVHGINVRNCESFADRLRKIGVILYTYKFDDEINDWLVRRGLVTARREKGEANSHVRNWNGVMINDAHPAQRFESATFLRLSLTLSQR